MTNQILEERFQQDVGEKVKLYQIGDDRYRIFTPFTLTDGDHLAIVLKKEKGKWLLSDSGSTFMHLSFGIDEKDLLTGNRSKIISRTLLSTNVFDRDGELITEVDGDDYGAALYNFTQALIKISDISYLSRDLTQSTFVEDFKNLIQESLSSDSFEFDWFDSDRDSQRCYQVDCKVKRVEEPLFIYALKGDDKVAAATISIYNFQDWGLRFKPVAFFENKKQISRKVLSRFEAVCHMGYDAEHTSQFSQGIRQMVQSF
jgi:hypothetical protein